MSRSARFTVPRKITALILYLGGTIAVLIQGFRGDPDALASIFVGLSLIAIITFLAVRSALFGGILTLTPRETLIGTCIFYACTVGTFALVYRFFDHVGGIQRPECKTPLDGVGAVYLSVATITGLGYTDRYPVSDWAKITAIAEVLLGLTYAVLIFSALANFIREGRPANVDTKDKSAGDAR